MTPKPVDIIVDGVGVRTHDGVTVAAALLNAQASTFRRSVSGAPRAPLCGMGVCYECRVTIDDVPHQRSCLRVVSSGMRVDTADRRIGDASGE
ncbi:MAG TPA: (2Fe-2S)-binding protein [Gemmatimonadaceae bacterium]|jgi:sarcosine oxidase subunit alpha|nr:(2Fe-2S)-binding protein [Gemmatimonadaceae bacterium]